jgi:hypothetical protein
MKGHLIADALDVLQGMVAHRRHLAVATAKDILCKLVEM